MQTLLALHQLFLFLTITHTLPLVDATLQLLQEYNDTLSVL